LYLIETNEYMEKYNGDPSGIIQVFPKFNLNILCCRLWWMKNWEHRELAYPFWRIYYNRQPGASIIYDDKEICLETDKIYMISPNTRYASRLFNHTIPVNGHVLTGGRLSVITAEEKDLINNNRAVEHLFIHFTLGFPYDNISPGIYSFYIDPFLQSLLDKISENRKKDIQTFDMHTYLILQTLICGILMRIDKHYLEVVAKDKRVNCVINYVEKNINGNLSNEILANKACMAKNSFSFLFKKEFKMPLQQFIRQKRIDKACMMLLHSNLSIDDISDATGFHNRYHFSRIFKEVTSNTPAHYRKEYML